MKRTLSVGEVTSAFSGVIKALKGDSDLACATLGAAYVEKLLGVILRRLFVESKSLTTRMFGTGGLLENSGGQNDIAMATGIISEECHRNIRLINGIRDEFAHSHRQVTFQNVDVSNMCRDLTFFFPNKAAHKTFLRKMRFTAKQQFATAIGVSAGYLQIVEQFINQQENSLTVDKAIGKIMMTTPLVAATLDGDEFSWSI
ncbi:MAG TPA: hypothetical protein VMR25_04435 [Planctomycetaceae bacterium]|jgi:hypothetical protein|nr:hypothetical protein [Planctomycetaceae bacterium]